MGAAIACYFLGWSWPVPLYYAVWLPWARGRVAVFFSAPYRLQVDWLPDSTTPSGVRLPVDQALIALVSGHWLRRWAGLPACRSSFICPEAHTDFVLPLAWLEELGMDRPRWRLALLVSSPVRSLYIGLC